MTYPNFQKHLYIDPDERLLIFGRGECGYALAVERSQVTSHLRDKHHVQECGRRGLTHDLNTRYPQGFRNPADLPLPEDGAEINPRLRVYEGFACCTYIAPSITTSSRNISRRSIWVAARLRGRGLTICITMPTSKPGLRAPLDDTGLAEGQARSYNTIAAAPTLAGTGPWIERTRWEITYRGFRRDILQSLVEMPRSPPCTNHVVGPSSNPTDPELASPQNDEAKLALLVLAVDHMLDLREETMLHTGRTLLCWLRSTRLQTCYPKPFTLVALKSSKRKYRQLKKRFFAFIFRAFRMPVTLRHDDGIEDVVEGEQDDDDDGDGRVGLGDDDGYQEENRFDNVDPAVDELLELVFYGVLGLSADARGFLPAKKFTPHLSALIYIQRLLFLEYALPFRPYPHLGIPQRARFRQHQHFDAIREKYMITGSPTPLDEFQSLRDFGRVIARTDPPSFLLRWSDDGETVSYGDDFNLTMEIFRGLAEPSLTKAEGLRDDLMFWLKPCGRFVKGEA
ncbi:hypothetical protein V496_01372 [Pseudogymnoascus sp. VKM F-4515 (FW-2607)]|nr:hypothetical protein V496_01372 [Pseudogymnoascus sp. VKM F-4515 (FW-2607)]